MGVSDPVWVWNASYACYVPDNGYWFPTPCGYGMHLQNYASPGGLFCGSWLHQFYYSSIFPTMQGIFLTCTPCFPGIFAFFWCEPPAAFAAR